MLSSDYVEMLSTLSEEGVEFLVVGAHALAAHGVPRATGDMDLWIHATPENAQRVWRALQRFGAPLMALTVGDLTRPDVVFQIGVVPCRIDILTSIDGVEFDEAWRNRMEVVVDGVRIQVLGREELRRNKRASGRPQDLVDLSRLDPES